MGDNGMRSKLGLLHVLVIIFRVTFKEKVQHGCLNDTPQSVLCVYTIGKTNLFWCGIIREMTLQFLAHCKALTTLPSTENFQMMQMEENKPNALY